MSVKQNKIKALEPAALPPAGKSKRSLTKAQESLLAVLKDPAILGLKPPQIAQLAGISPATYWAAFNDSDFIVAIEAEVPKLLAASELPTIQNVLAKASDPATKSHHWAATALKMMGKLDSDAKKDTTVILNFYGITRPKFVDESKIIEGKTE